MLKPCPCGAVPDNLEIEGCGKWGWVSGGCCGEWAIEFRLQYADPTGPEAYRAACVAWDDAPRDAALTARAEKAERERDEARARIAAAVEWAAANKPFGGNGTISNEIHASMAEGDRLDVILSDAPALAVVEGKVVANALTDNRREIIIYRAHSNGVFLVEPIPVTVVVLHANAVLERGVDHPTLSEG